MSHEIEIINGKASTFYYGDTPWHKLGTSVENALTSDEAITAAGLNWNVEQVNLFHNWQGNRIKIEDKVGIRRNTDGKILGVLSHDYVPLQNVDAFRFFDGVVGEKKAIYHTAGSLRDGKKIWILAKLPDTMLVKGKDEVDKYLLLMNGHDGTVAIKMFFTPIRVVCSNTLTSAELGTKKIEMFYSKHTGGVMARMEVARDILGITTKFYDNFLEMANHLANIQLPAPELPKLLAASFGTSGAIRPEDVVHLDDIGKARRVNEMAHVQALFEGEGKGLNDPAIRGTKWAAYNAIVEFLDYGKQFRGKDADSNRLEATWLSRNQQIKNKAINYLLKN